MKQETKIKQLEKEIKKLKAQKKSKNLLEELSKDKDIRALAKAVVISASIILPIKLIDSIGD